jgi:hypothetical protein
MLKSIELVLIYLAMTLTARACCGNDIDVSPWPQLPPPQYAHAYHGKLTVHYGTEAQIHRVCGFNARACAMPRGSNCTIWLPSPTSGGAPEIYAALRTHEIAHCNGWAH